MVFVKSKEMQVPCGKCPECVKAKYYSWLFRLDKELERSDNPLFVTLTMRDEHITWTNQGNQTLCKRDLQLFFKRLRKKHEKTYPTYQKRLNITLSANMAVVLNDLITILFCLMYLTLIWCTMYGDLGILCRLNSLMVELITF